MRDGRQFRILPGTGGLSVFRTGAWLCEIVGSSGYFQEQVDCPYSGQGPGDATWQAVQDTSRNR